MEKVNICMSYTHTWIDHPLLFIISVNDRVLHIDNSGKQQCQLNKTINLPYGSHQFKIQIQNKNEANTVIDKNRNVVQDTLLNIESISFNQIETKSLILDRQKISYFQINNQTDQLLEKTLEFGYNGTFIFNFKNPVYEWLLETIF